MDNKKTVLLIDDEKSIRLSMEMVLKPLSYKLLYCSEISCAKQIFNKSHEISLVILDLVMPNGSGFEFLDYVREKRIKVPIIVLSALDSAKAATEALKRGAQDYVTKPFSLDEIRTKIRGAITA